MSGRDRPCQSGSLEQPHRDVRGSSKEAAGPTQRQGALERYWRLGSLKRSVQGARAFTMAHLCTVCHMFQKDDIAW